LFSVGSSQLGWTEGGEEEAGDFDGVGTAAVLRGISGSAIASAIRALMCV
jgi:hypothetical protein